jgi:hypothetical protein
MKKSGRFIFLLNVGKLNAMKRKIHLTISLCLLSHLIFMNAWAEQAGFAFPDMKLTGIQGVFIHSEGYRLKWRMDRMDAILMTGFNYVTNPKVMIYIPGQKKPLEIMSGAMKIDAVRKDFFFEKNVTVKTAKGILFIDFLRFDANRLEMSSFDRYVFKTKGSHIRGRAIHGLAKSKGLTLFNVKEGKIKKSSLTVSL